MELTRLTDNERKFAEDNHKLIYSFLSSKGYSIEDYYNIVVFGYLKAVQVYSKRADLQEKYKFSVIAWKYMQSEIGNHFRTETAKKRATEESLLSLDADNDDTENLYNNMVGGKSAESNIMESAAVQDILSKLTETQKEIVCMKAEGYNNTEICTLIELPQSTFYKEMTRIKKALNSRR